MTFRKRTPEELTQNIAGTLCYVTVLPAIMFLLVKPYSENRFVRFHAYQSIFFSIVFFAAEFLLNFLTLAANFFAHLFMPISLAFFVVWIFCMVKAYKNLTWKLPILGDLAASQAQR